MPKKIFFIEDEPDQVMMFKMRLEANGYDVKTALDGKEGLEKIDKEKPDLVLLDIIMPKMNGYEVCKRLKENPKTKNIPILIMTASGAEDSERKCMALGADDCIRKPCESDELLGKINKLLNK